MLGQQGGSSCFGGRGVQQKMSERPLPGFDSHQDGGGIWASEWCGVLDLMSLGA